MRILLIGGTKFLGRHVIMAAQARQHEVTIFHRGKHSSEGIGGVEEIYGDRTVDLNKLTNRRWDAVVDTCGYLPQTVKASAEALVNSVGQYVFISSISAYADFSSSDYDETTPLATLTEEQTSSAAKIDAKAEITAAVLDDMYGALKALCEDEAQKIFGDKTLIVRSGLLVGPLDPTDRFTYWASRIERGGEVLAPGTPHRFVQFIDARDLSEWIIGMIERRAAGIYNATGQLFALTFGDMLAAMKATSRSNAAFTWVSEQFLKQEAIKEWSEMPLYLAESVKEMSGFLSANSDKAAAENLIFRPLAETIQDTLSWRATQDTRMQAGITFEREQLLLRKWHEEKQF